jgi:cobalt/nickel transport system permease protein
MDQETVFYVGNVAISRGWAYFIAILLRGLLSMQATLLLMLTTPFSEICIGLRTLHVPKIFISILEMIYRYLWVLLREAVSMEIARRARSYDRKHFSLKLWGIFVAQLLMRSIDRAERITQAMQARLA